MTLTPLRLVLLGLVLAAMSSAGCVDADTAPSGRRTPAEGTCFVDDDCGDPALCFDVECRRLPACYDGLPECTDACAGVCADATHSVYCLVDDDCDEEFHCRIDERFCLEDRRPDPVAACVGWCVPGCFLIETYAVDPVSQGCFPFGDSCTPPGFSRPAAPCP